MCVRRLTHSRVRRRHEYRVPAAVGKAKAGIPLADETQGVQVKLCYPLTMRAIPECLRDASCAGAIQIDYLYLHIDGLSQTITQIVQVISHRLVQPRCNVTLTRPSFFQNRQRTPWNMSMNHAVRRHPL